MAEENPLNQQNPGSPEPAIAPTEPAATTTPSPVADAAASAAVATESTAATTPAPPPSPESAVDYPAPTGSPVVAGSTVTAQAPAQGALPQTPPPPPGGAVPGAPATTSGGTQPKKRIWPWVLAGSIVAALLLIGGVVACTSTVFSAAVQSMQQRDSVYDRSDLYNYDTQDGLWNYFYGGNDATFDDLLDAFNVDAGDPSGADHGRGAYRVSSTDGIAPGLYYLAGTDTGVSNFYVFDGDDHRDRATTYELETSVEFFGNYYATLDEGDCIIYVPQGDDDTFHLATNEPMAVNAPYQSGCYRVGVDIPAGTYIITANADEARTTDSDSGAFVMKDLDFDDDSITDSAYVIKGGRQSVTVKNGDYLELFAAIATPDDGSMQPQQRSEQQQQQQQQQTPLYGHHHERGGCYYGA